MAQAHPPRRTKRSVRRREALNSSSSSADESKPSPLSRVFISHSPPPLSKNNISSSSPSTLMRTHQRTTDTQTTQDNQTFLSKSIPSFAETQLLSIYYLNRNIHNQISPEDPCIFVEQQKREPIRFRANYDPSASSKSTQTSPPLPNRSLSTHGSTLIIDANQRSSSTNNRLYEQRLKIHSGSQRLANLSLEEEEPLSPSELVEESRYSYEEYIIKVDNSSSPANSSPSPTPTTSSVTTILVQPPPEPIQRTMLQPDELDSDRTSRLSGDDNNTHSSTSSMSGSFTNQDWPLIDQPTAVNTETNARISSWPPVPYDLPPADAQFETSFVLDESDEQRRPSRVQFAEQLVRVIPPSATNSLSEESAPVIVLPEAPAVIPRSTPPTTTTTTTNEQTNIEERMAMVVEEDENTTTTTTTTSSNPEAIPGRLQRTSGLTNLNEVMMKRPNIAPPPPPTSLSPGSSSSSGVDPRLVREQLQRLDYQLVVDTHPPANQSKWVKEHLDASDLQSASLPAAGRVDALRSLFEQHSARSSDSSTLNSPPGPIRRKEPEERPARHGDEIRFRVKEDSQPVQMIPTMPRTKLPGPATVASPSTTTTGNSTPVAPLTWEDLVGVQEEHQQRQMRTPVTLSPTSSVDLDEIRRITGRRIKTLDEVGFYLKDGRTWKWDETFWFGLTASQRDQLKRTMTVSRSRQDSGDTQINELSDRSAYQGDSEDNTPRNDHVTRRSGQTLFRPRNASEENLSPASSNDLNRTIRPTEVDQGSTISVTGAGAWQHSQASNISTGIGKYSEASTFHENQPTVSVFGSTPTATYTRIGSQESLASSVRQTPVINKKNENQTMIIESGYSSADEPQQRVNTQFRPQSSTIIEEPLPIDHSEGPIYENLRPDLLHQPAQQQQQQIESELDPFSYEQFVYDYFSNHAQRLRAHDDTLVLLIDGQQIAMPHLRLPHSDRLTLSKNVFLDAIDEYPPPFETELDELVIFFHGEPIVLPADRWMFYKEKFRQAQWIHNLDRVNRRLPIQIMPIVEQWLTDHTTFLIESEEMNVDGLNIPLIGRMGQQILDLYRVRQLQSTETLFWSKVLKYLIQSGYVSFNPDEKLIQIAHSELDAHRLLEDRSSPSTEELIERLANLLRALENIHFDNQHGRLIIGEHFLLSQDEVADLLEKSRQGQTLNARELAERLVEICQIDEDEENQTMIITHQDQILRLAPRPTDPVDPTVRHWLAENMQLSSEQGRIFLIRYRSEPNYFLRITGDEGIRLATLLDEQRLDLDELIRWHQRHTEFDRTERSGRLMIKPNRNLEIVNLSLEENVKGREKSRTTNEKMRSRIGREGGGEAEEEKKNLVFFIPLHQQTSSDSEEEEAEEEEEKPSHHHQREQKSTPSPPTLLQTQREEQKKVKSISDEEEKNDDDDDERSERALFLQSISSLLHFVNANGSDVGTLELIQGRRLRLTLTGNSEISDEEQTLEFNEDDTALLHDQLELDIDACSEYLLDRIFDRIQYDSTRQFLLITYLGQMLKLKNLKQKFLQPASKKLRLSSNKNNANGSSTNRTVTEDDVIALTQWLDQLNREGFITITEQNDIVILPNGEDNQEQQIFINHDDVDACMENKVQNAKPGEQSEVITMADIARILLVYEYVQYSDGQLTFGAQRIALDRNELVWLRSIIRDVRPNGENRETEVDLFDGEHTQVLYIPYEHMPPTNNPIAVADYLFEHGNVRYDIDTGNYAYRYVPPNIPLDDEVEPAERLGQRQLLSSHIRQIHVDEDNRRIELEFLHDPTHRLPLPSRWYNQIEDRNFDRAYVIDLLLTNGGVVTHDTFTFNDRTYSLQVPRVSSSSAAPAGTNLQTVKLSSKQRQEIIENYVESIHRQEGIKRDNSNRLLLLENPADGSQLYLTPEHTRFIEENQFRRQDVIRLLTKNSQIKQDEFGNWLLYYNNQYVQFPADLIPQSIANKFNRSSSVFRSLGQRFTRQTAEESDAQFRARLAQETEAEFIERYHATIDYMYHHGFIICNRRLKLVQIHFSNQTLTIPLEHLRPIVDTRALNSTTDTSLPFESRQLSQWLLANSQAIRNTREGYIQLTHKDKDYNFPLYNPDNPPKGAAASGISALVKRFGLSSRSSSTLARIDFNNTDNQVRCANHLLEKLDQFSGINIDNQSRTLVLSMTPDGEEQLVIRNPVQPVTKQTLIDYLTSHGRFVLNNDRTDIEYRHFEDGRVYRFHNYIRDWEEAFGETGEERIVRVLGEILALNGRFLQRADRQIIISLRNGERFIIPSQIGSQLLGPVNGQTIAELLVRFADDIHEEQDGKILVVRLADQTLRLQQQKQLMSSRSASVTPSSKGANDPKLKLLFPFNKSLRQIQKTPSTSTLNVQPPDASNGYAIDPLLMLANYIYRAGSIYQDDLGRLVVKMNEDEIVVPRIEAINAIEAINTSPRRTGTIVARLIDRIGKVQSNKAGGLIITIGKSSFELPKELLDRANQLHRETIDVDNDLPVNGQDLVQAGLNGSLTLAGRHNRPTNGSMLLPLLRQSKSVGSLSSSTIGHPWFTDDQQMLYTKDGRGDARYLNLDNYSLAWQKEPHKHGVECDVRTIRNVTPYFNVLGYTEKDQKKGITINDLTRIHPEMLSRGKLNDANYLTQLENDRAQTQTTVCPKPRILVIPDDETMLSSNRKTRFYVQYMYDHDAVLGTDPAYVMMLPSRYPVRPTQPQLIAPHHYRDIALREAPVYVHKKGEGEVFFENLAQYLSSEHPDLSSKTVRRMLKYSPNEFREYLSKNMSSEEAERLAQESEETANEAGNRYVNVPTRTGAGGAPPIARRNLPENDFEDDDDEDLEEDFNRRGSRGTGRGAVPVARNLYNVSNSASGNSDDQRRGRSLRSNGSLQPPMSNSGKFPERSPSTSSFGSDMIIANTFPSQRSVLGNAPSANLPQSRNDPMRATTNPLSSLTDENYGRPVPRGNK